MAKKKIQIEQRAITIKELQFWLKGMSEFQPANWVPNKEQWELIKNKIYFLINEDNTQNYLNRPNRQPESLSGIPTEGGHMSDAQMTFPVSGAGNATTTGVAIPNLPKHDAQGFLIPPNTVVTGGSQNVAGTKAPSISGEPSPFV